MASFAAYRNMNVIENRSGSKDITDSPVPSLRGFPIVAKVVVARYAAKK